MNKFLKLLLGTSLYLLDQSDSLTKGARDRAADRFSDLRDVAQEKFETASDRVTRASRAIRGESRRRWQQPDAGGSHRPDITR